LKDWVFRGAWPLPRALDLVRAPIAEVAPLVAEAVPAPRRSAWERHRSLDQLFSAVAELATVPTLYLVLPARGWTVIWCNSARCDGADALSARLARGGLDTLHLEASDTDGPCLAGCAFTYRLARDRGRPTRRVTCARAGDRWRFEAAGEPLPGEDLARYRSRAIAARLDEQAVMTVAAALGAEPWRERFYDLGAPGVHRVERLKVPASVDTVRVADVLGPGTPPPRPRR
jgi:hypothetical protein